MCKVAYALKIKMILISIPHITSLKEFDMDFLNYENNLTLPTEICKHKTIQLESICYHLTVGGGKLHPHAFSLIK